MESLGINLGFLLVQVLNFVVILLILRAWVYHPLIDMLAKRRATIQQSLEDARVAAEARTNAEEEAQKIIAEAQSKATQLVQEATERAEMAASDVKATAEDEATQTLQVALTEAEQERNRILADVRGQVAALAIAATQKLIGDALDEQRQHALIEEFFSGVKTGKIILLEGERLSGVSAEVTSALPLTPEEQEIVKKDVLAKIGDQATVTFRVDPEILGGLVIRVGDKVMDGSVAGHLIGLKQSLS